MENVLRRGSAARMDYIRRFLAVMLALVLCAGLALPPRAKAAAGAGSIAATSSVNPVSALGVLILAATGVDVQQAALTEDFHGSGIYAVGNALMDAIKGEGTFSDWYDEVVELVSGGHIFDAKVYVPAPIMEAARSWVKANYDFSSGPVLVTSQGIFADGSFIIFTLPPMSYEGAKYLVTRPGTTFKVDDTINFGDKDYRFVFFKDPNPEYDGWHFGWYIGDDSIVGWYGSYDGLLGNVNQYVGALCVYQKCITPVIYDPVNKSVVASPLNSKLQYLNPASNVVVDSLTLASTPALDIPGYEDTTVAFPSDTPKALVNGVEVPIISNLDREAVVVESGEIVVPTPIPTAVPGEATMVGDVALEDVAAEQESLGAVFISKFPFSIPWDLYNAVKLLAAPAKTPHWEVDFLEPISSRVGGWRGSTKIVIDLSDYEVLGQLSRWVSTILFCAALISGTKRLIWTA